MSEVWIYHEKLDRYVQVPESAVGMHNMSGWVQQDPPPEPEAVEEKPAKNASRDAWAAYAMTQGIAAEDAYDMGRDELIAFFEDDKPAEPQGEKE